MPTQTETPCRHCRHKIAQSDTIIVSVCQCGYWIDDRPATADELELCLIIHAMERSRSIRRGYSEVAAYAST